MGLQIKRKAEVLGSDQFQRTKTVRIATPPPAIKSLPEDLLVEILAKVAASSFSDLYNAKLANKDFLEAATDGQIFRHVSLQSIPKFSWKNTSKFSSFMKNGENNGNSEAFYRKGMIEFFSHNKEASGLAHLKAFAEKGHVEASYVYGIILHYRRSKNGVEFLKRCEAKGGARMAECRRRIKAFVWGMWIRNKYFSPEREYSGGRRSCICVVKNILPKRMMGWGWIDEEDCYGNDMCEACKWNGEVSRFCKMLRTGGYN